MKHDRPRRWRRLGAAATALLAGTLLAACSATSLLYQQADWLATEYVDGFLALDDQQEEALHARMQAALVWHRSAELPQYADWLEEVERHAGGGVERAALQQLAQGVDVRLARLGARMAADLAPTLVTLRPEQLAHLVDRFRERDLETQARHADPDSAARLERRRERVLERVETWTGTLRPAQRAELARLTDALPDNGPLWLQYRRAQEGRLLRMLREDHGVDALQGFVGSWLGRTGEDMPRMRLARAQMRAALVELAIGMDGVIDDAQRQHLRERLREYAGLARRLARSS